MVPKKVYPEYPFTSRYLQLDGGRLHYVDEGEGPVVVMVHGNPTWSYYFRHLIAQLRENHRVIVLDHMGCGLSDKPQNYSYCLAQHIENLEHLLTHLQICRFSLVVHDWGGAIGIGCAVNHVNNIEKIVVMNTAAFRSNRIPGRIKLCRLPVVGEIIVRLFNGFAWPAQFMAVTKKLDPDVAKAYLAPYNSWNNRVAVYNFVKDIPLDPSHKSYAVLANIENRLSLLRDAAIPFLIVWGGRDFCFNDAFFEEWKKRFPDAENHYFHDGGHYILEDKQVELVPIFDSFFRI
ncbi:MAG: alpha/beta fold hydrolase [Desulforhopalus sp.]